ncbi:MEDS domain-containing protein [Fictibacillus iocasae]|uniref:MEDS domain-containing protein n=1 Tax=Fictibacillus iocasae TaxID=2715437 RepID=A0ABW2NZ42_9BACL
MNSKMHQLFEEHRSVHVVYTYNGFKDYVAKAVQYIETGIAAEDTVILIENERLYRLIQEALKTRITKEQWQFIHHINNFDFYYSSGSYHPPAIVDYFIKTVEPYLNKKKTFRFWAHVEWATMEDPLHLIEDLEKVIDEAVNDMSFPLICAYEAARMPDYLKTVLMETHPYVLLEDEFIASDQYIRKVES